MKKLIIILILLLTPLKSYAYDWKWYNTGLELTYETLQYIDWKQTREFTGQHWKYPNSYETNPFIGAYPTAKRVNVYMGATMLLHPVISYVLVTSNNQFIHDMGLVFQATSITIEADAVSHNYSVGVVTTFKIF